MKFKIYFNLLKYPMSESCPFGKKTYCSVKAADKDFLYAKTKTIGEWSQKVIETGYGVIYSIEKVK